MFPWKTVCTTTHWQIPEWDVTVSLWNNMLLYLILPVPWLCSPSCEHFPKRGMELTAVFIFIFIEHNCLELGWHNVQCPHLSGTPFVLECFEPRRYNNMTDFPFCSEIRYGLALFEKYFHQILSQKKTFHTVNQHKGLRSSGRLSAKYSLRPTVHSSVDLTG